MTPEIAQQIRPENMLADIEQIVRGKIEPAQLEVIRRKLCFWFDMAVHLGSEYGPVVFPQPQKPIGRPRGSRNKPKVADPQTTLPVNIADHGRSV